MVLEPLESWLVVARDGWDMLACSYSRACGSKLSNQQRVTESKVVRSNFAAIWFGSSVRQGFARLCLFLVANIHGGFELSFCDTYSSLCRLRRLVFSVSSRALVVWLWCELAVKLKPWQLSWNEPGVALRDWADSFDSDQLAAPDHQGGMVGSQRNELLADLRSMINNKVVEISM